MPIKFTPITDESAPPRKETKFLPLEGEFPFTVLGSSEVASKSAKNPGKMMFRVKLNVHGPKYDLHVYDYFADWFSEWKMKHFAETCGIEDTYQNGEMDATLNAWSGLQGMVRLKIEAGANGDKSAVDDYFEEDVLAPEAKPAPAIKPAVNPNTKPAGPDDDIPF